MGQRPRWPGTTASPAPWNSPPDGGLVPLRQAPRPHSLGADPRPPGSFATQALLCTDPAADPTQILEWFVLRWQLEVTFHEVRTHLGVETQRQWSDLAIARTTPALLGLFSWTTLAAHALQKRRPMTQRKAACTTNRRRPSWMPSPWRVATCGWRRKVSHCRSLTPTFRNSRSLCTTDL